MTGLSAVVLNPWVITYKGVILQFWRVIYIIVFLVTLH